MDARLLLRDFNDYRSQTGNVQKLKGKGSYITSLKGTPTRLRALERMAAWCQQRGLNPRLWLYSLFHSRKWMYAPLWNQLTPEANLPRYHALLNTDPFQKKVQNEVHADQRERGASYDPNRDVSATTEALKRRFLDLNDAPGCMARMTTETLGFHPRSTVCARCAQAARCADTLRAMVRFDILAYRAGTITLEQARQQERATYYARR